MLTRDHGIVHFACDGSECPEQINTHCVSLDLALAVMRREGWMAMEPEDMDPPGREEECQHWCPGCGENQ